MKVICIKEQKKYIDDFLNLPTSLYNSNDKTHNRREEKQLITRKHALSHYFTLQAFLVVNNNNVPIARCAITTYTNDDKAYLGLFECINDKSVSLLLFSSAQDYCIKMGKHEIIGPVDASIWIKYRLKIDNFDTLYTGEPYNKDYYKDLFMHSGFNVYDKFISNIYKILPEYKSEKATKRLNSMIEKGYIIKNITMKSFNSDLNDIYSLLIDLYSTFPAFKHISRAEFISMFKNLKYIADFKTVKLAYYKNELVGFLVSIPNYGKTLCGKFTPYKLMQFLKKKYKSKEYTILYMGVKKGHAGLGMAMAETIRRQVAKRNVLLIGALIQQGKVTANYFGDIIEKQCQYCLFCKKI